MEGRVCIQLDLFLLFQKSSKLLLLMKMREHVVLGLCFFNGFLLVRLWTSFTSILLFIALSFFQVPFCPLYLSLSPFPFSILMLKSRDYLFSLMYANIKRDGEDVMNFQKIIYVPSVCWNVNVGRMVLFVEDFKCMWIIT